MKNSIFKIFKRTFQRIFFLVTACMLINCAKKVIPELQQTDKFIEGKIIDNNGFEVYNAEVYLYGTDITTTTDEKGYFKLILPKEYKLTETYYVEVLTNENGYNPYGFNISENKINDLKLENLDLTIIEKISNKNLPIIYGTPIREEDLKFKFKIVYDYIYDSPPTLDESLFEDNGKPVPNATIKIIGEEETYITNENGEIWIEKDKIQEGDVMVIQEEMHTPLQLQVTSEILSGKIIPYSILINMD